MPHNWKGFFDCSLVVGSVFPNFLHETFSERGSICCKFYAEPQRMFSRCSISYSCSVLVLISVQLVSQKHCAHALLTLVPFLGEGYSSEVAARLIGTGPRVRTNETFRWVNTDHSRLRSWSTLVTFSEDAWWCRRKDEAARRTETSRPRLLLRRLFFPLLSLQSCRHSWARCESARSEVKVPRYWSGGCEFKSQDSWWATLGLSSENLQIILLLKVIPHVDVNN